VSKNLQTAQQTELSAVEMAFATQKKNNAYANPDTLERSANMNKKTAPSSQAKRAPDTDTATQTERPALAAQTTLEKHASSKKPTTAETPSATHKTLASQTHARQTPTPHQHAHADLDGQDHTATHRSTPPTQQHTCNAQTKPKQCQTAHKHKRISDCADSEHSAASANHIMSEKRAKRTYKTINAKRPTASVTDTESVTTTRASASRISKTHSAKHTHTTHACTAMQHERTTATTQASATADKASREHTAKPPYAKQPEEH